MKTSELIKKLQTLQEKHGDNVLIFAVGDSYSRFPEYATMHLQVGEDDDKPSSWSGVYSNNGYTTIDLHLNKREGKNPKITFRK